MESNKIVFSFPNWYLGGGFKYVYFHPYLGKIPILTNIFQMGWNHQPDIFILAPVGGNSNSFET